MIQKFTIMLQLLDIEHRVGFCRDVEAFGFIAGVWVSALIALALAVLAFE